MSKTEAEIRADEKRKIAKWLNGLEYARARVERITNDPNEKSVMEARRGIYEGIADDILGGAADRAV